MKASDAHVQHYPEDSPCNRCSFLACRNRPLTYFRQCSAWREWFADRWQGYQIAAEKIKTSR